MKEWNGWRRSLGLVVILAAMFLVPLPFATSLREWLPEWLFVGLAILLFVLAMAVYGHGLIFGGKDFLNELKKGRELYRGSKAEMTERSTDLSSSSNVAVKDLGKPTTNPDAQDN